MEQLRLSVPGMTCGHCVTAVQTGLRRVPGVGSVDVDLASKAVVVSGRDLDADALCAAVDEAGYDAVVEGA